MNREGHSVIRTVHVNTEKTWGDAVQQTSYLVHGLASRGHPTFLVCQPDSPLAKEEWRPSVTMTTQPMHGHVSPVATLHLSETIRNSRADIVHMHTPDAEKLGCAAALMAHSARCVVTRDVDFAAHRSSLNIWKYHRRVDRYIVNSKAAKRAIASDGVDSHRIAAVHAGIDTARFHDTQSKYSATQLGLSPDAMVIGTVAHTADRKGMGHLVDAFSLILKMLPQAHLVIIGNGRLYEEVLHRAAHRHVRRSVTFFGLGKETPVLMQAFDVFVMPGNTNRHAIPIIEAMASSVPVVAVKTDAVSEIIAGGKHGLLVPAGKREALAHAIITLLSDKELSLRLVETAQRTVDGRFTIDALVENTLAVYRTVLAENGEESVHGHWCLTSG